MALKPRERAAPTPMLRPRFIFPLLLGALFGFNQPVCAEALNLQQIAPGVYVHQGVPEWPDRRNHGEIANIGFIEGSRCVAIIDTGGSPEQGRALRDAVRSTTPTPICFVINTHVHPDHIYGNRAFKEPGVRFVGHHKLAAAIAARASFYRDKASRDLDLTLTPDDFVMPDMEVTGDLELDLGGRRLTLTAHGTAHTDNDLSVYDHNTQTFWLADLLFMDHLPVIDGSLNGWLAVLDRVKQTPAKRAVPGHGPIAAFWPSAAEPEERYLRRLQAEVRSAIKQGRTIEQAMASVGQSAPGPWRLFEEFHPRNVATAFAELEWEDE